MYKIFKHLKTYNTNILWYKKNKQIPQVVKSSKAHSKVLVTIGTFLREL